MTNHLKFLLTLSILFGLSAVYAQYSAPAAFDWANKYGSSPDNDDTKDMAVDANGNILTVGLIRGTSTFGSVTVMANYEGYVAKTSPSGQVLWAKHIPNTVNLYGVAADAAGNVYVTGTLNFYGNYTFGSSTINVTNNSYSTFFGKIDANGNFLWAKIFGQNGSSDGFGVKVDASGNIYLSGIFSGNMAMGSFNLSTGGTYVCKMDNTGTVLWAKSTSGRGIKIDVNSTGDVYVAGHFSGTFDFNNTNSYGGWDVFLTKFNSSGTQQWLKHFGGSSTEFLGDMCLDPSGNVYLSGNFNGTAYFETNTYTSGGAENIFYLKTNASGTVTWAKHLSSNGSQDIARGIYADASGNVYLAINFRNTIQVNGTGYPSWGWIDAMIVKANSSGNQLWAYQFGGSYDDFAVGVYANASGEVFCAGDFSDDLGDWDVILEPNAGGYTDLTVFKLKMCSALNASINQTGNTLNVTPSVPGAEYIWQTCSGNTIQGATASTFNPTSNGSYMVWINNNGCVSRTACKTFTSTTVGVDELSPSFQLYPNPVQQNLVLSFEETVSLSNLKLVTLEGQTAKTFSDFSSQEQTLDLSGIATGVYFLEGNVNGTHFVQRVVKE